MIRPATLDDLEALLAIEQHSFAGDRISRRSFRHLLTQGHALTLLDEDAGMVRGYVMLLFRSGLRSARAYSIATDARWRGCGVAAGLLAAAESAACARDCTAIRLEIRKDNLASLTLFSERRYHCTGTRPRYYQDGMDAFRFAKRLSPVSPLARH